MTNKAFMLTQVQRDFLILLLSIQPHLSQPQMTALFEDKFQIKLTAQQLKTLIKNSRQKVEELQKSEALTLELAIKVGLVNLHSKISRTLELQNIVRMCVDGYEYQTQSSRGEVVTLTKREPKTAVDAIRSLREEWAERIEPTSSYTIIVKDSEPEQEESLAGDEDL
ncbi:hypothetical protein [Nostoc sp. UHCC 0251]|uniref:hypothetical protein n=1 Tax=Nostoc sp. UHCC 0251 TaxID=3110240 RepID=UPI002B20C11A|nr:hypothetical protein [Nostoc sp. UHCC 0251]MEA5625305.1 hypothetical protein [Nostoc sp. UHCC 0251]